MNCTKCNAELKPGARFCHVCGFDMQSAPAVTPVNPTQTQNTMEQNTNPTPPQPTAQSPFVSRIIGILTKPKSEWSLIEKETPNQTKLFTEYVLLLALIPAVAAFIGYGLIGINYGWIKVSGVSWGLGMAINSYLTSIISVFVTSFVINALAPSFGVQKNSGRAFQLVVFSMIPMWVGGIFMVLPTLAIISSLIGIYSLYHLYIGLDFTMKPTTEKKVGYFVVSLLVLIVVYIIIGYILGITIGRIFEPDELRGLRELNRMFN